MNTILFPTDFSDSTDLALDWAKLFARQYKAKLIILHVQQIPMPDTSIPTIGDVGIGTFNNSMAVDLEPIDRDRLNKLAAQLQAEGITCQTELRWGSVTDAVISAADDFQAELIIIGRTELSNFFERLLGTEATGVARKAHCPVLVVPTAEARPAQLHSILFATPLVFDQLTEFGEVVAIAHTFGTSLTLLHVHAGDQPSLTESSPAIDQLQQLYGRERLGVETVESPTVTAGIETYLKTNHPDLLVMTHRERDFLAGLLNPGLADRMVILTDTPMLIYHAQGDL